MMFSKIDRLKREARSNMLAYRRLTDDLDCGNSMAEMLLPEAQVHRQKYEAALAQLKELDPNFPKATS